MRNKNLKKALCLILLSFLLSTITLTSFADEPVVGEPYIEEIDTSELKLYVPGIPGVTRDIPLSEKGNTVSLGSSIKAEYLQKAAIGINSEEGFMPSEKDVLFVLDTSFLEGDSNEFLSLVEHTLFSREDATILGGGMTIDGKSFIKDNIVNHNDSIEINGNIEYSEIGPHNIKSITGEEIILSEDENDKNYKGKYDHYFPEETGFGGINYIFKKIMANAEENVYEEFNESRFPSYFPRDTRLLYHFYGSPANDPFANDFSHSSNHGNFENLGNSPRIDLIANPKTGQQISILLDPKVSTDLRVRYEPVVTANGSEPIFEKGKFTITGGEPFVIRSDMYFDGDLTISVKSISKELSDNGQAGYIFAYGDIIFQGEKTIIEDDLFLVSMTGDIIIESGDNNFTGLALAPNGTITIRGRENNYKGSFIGKNLNITPGNSTFTGPDDPHDLIPGDYQPPSTNLNNETQNAIFGFLSKLGTYTKPGAILYSYVATRIESVEGGDFTDSLKEALSERNDIDLEDEENLDPKIFLSNLGDALRLVSYELKELEDRTSEKYVVIFTGSKPDAYSTHPIAGGFYMEESPAPGFNEESDPEKANEYVKKVISELLPDVNLVFVDISPGGSMMSYFNELSDSYNGSHYTGSITIEELKRVGDIPEILAGLLEDEDRPVQQNYSLDLKKAVFNAPLSNLNVTSAFINDTKIDEEKINFNDGILSIEIPIEELNLTGDSSSLEINDIKVSFVANVINNDLDFVEEKFGLFKATIPFEEAYIRYTFDILLNGSSTSDGYIDIPFEGSEIKIEHKIDTN